MNSEKPGKPLRVGIISIHPAPYRDATFSALARRGVVDLTVLTLFELTPYHGFWDLEKQAYPNVLLRKCFGRLRPWCFHPGMLPLLNREGFDVILVPGNSYATMWCVMYYCRLTRTPFIFSGDKICDRSQASMLGSIGKRLLSDILRSASACYVPGKASRQYLIGRGVAEDQIFEGAYNLDYATIRKRVEEERENRPKFRQELSIDEDAFVFLMVANLLPNRRYDLLLKSFTIVASQHPYAHLLLVGNGLDATTVANLSPETETKNVHCVGPVAFDALAPLYAASDVYVHSGGEPYSTAVAYGAIAGLPIVTTPDVGAASDYLVEGQTGYVVTSENVAGFAEKMSLLAEDRELAKKQGLAAAKVASRYSSEWAAEQLEQAVAAACGCSKVRHRLYQNKGTAE
jgi:glycosyltransferase involved in cell wall biosynthesis